MVGWHHAASTARVQIGQLLDANETNMETLNQLREAHAALIMAVEVTDEAVQKIQESERRAARIAEARLEEELNELKALYEQEADWANQLVPDAIVEQLLQGAYSDADGDS